MKETIFFASNLKLLRGKAGLNQGQLGTSLGVSKNMVSYYENTQSIPDMLLLLKVSVLFNVDLNGLVLTKLIYLKMKRLIGIE